MSKIKVGFTTLFTLILFSMFAAMASAEETPFVPTPSNPAPNIHVGTIDNNGNVGTHRTHGNFQNNTNSCGNCHSTHNGDSATLLKFEETESDLCLSCHDGTLGFYNVEKNSGAGVFNSTHDSASMHNVGTVAIASAPGALNPTAEELQCSSCHNPHGSTNDRLLKTTVNGKTYSTAAIDLELVEDPAYQDINLVTGPTGLKIYLSKGPVFVSQDLPDVPQRVYSNFCSTCHEDYLKSSGSQRVDGHYTHTTNSYKSGRNCASCHYAHGTDITLLKDTAGKTVADYVKTGWTQEKAEAYMKDVSAGGSAIKKYTNMAVCWACHQSTHKLDTPPVVGGNYSGKPTR
jgi:predicted CXXCH cytochrome family protein